MLERGPGSDRHVEGMGPSLVEDVQAVRWFQRREGSP